jgi:Arc/MetJ-type ribon-helix-helix transcriptional regulator
MNQLHGRFAITNDDFLYVLSTFVFDMMRELQMRTVKITVIIDQDLLSRLDRFVAANRFMNRSQAVREAIRGKLPRVRRSRLARECARLDPRFEQALAESATGWAGA